MKILSLTATLLLLPLLTQAQTELPDQKSKLSYTIGLQAGQMLRKQAIDVNPETLRAGLEDGLQGKTPRLSESEVQTTLTTLQNGIAEKQTASRKSEGDKNAFEGPKFLTANKTKPGVVTTASGLQYQILHPGSGPHPTEDDRVVVNFIGSFTDGREFESTFKSGHAETIPVNRMIKGWREALKLMNAGAKYRLFVPPDLAFGKEGAGVVAPNATLIFDMELVGIVPVPTPTPRKTKAHAAAPSPTAK